MASSTDDTPLDSLFESIALIIGFTAILFVLIQAWTLDALLFVVVGLNLVVIYLLYRILVAVEHVAQEI
ncbi:hypothetical protein [Halostagnicola sp. A-GB9-2]|uniref:hypothetical protein n=1 Tax=Halostagnicola sp. A-GB9-2 TaxID=3048066 RepID=UPI0024BFFEF3|nr:hypothetical protein [Halostagnicola sp. A-GB9-2]MDJ1432568.1 hypothetical protein [Halostagnicola sp. A-GB9-2]